MKKNLITRIGRLMAMPLAVAALVACNEDNIVDNTQMDAVGISVAMTGTAETVTRATTTLPSGDLKLLYGSLTSSQTAVYTGSGTSWSSTAPLYWQQLASEQGKYPFYAVSPSDAGMTAVPADQSTAAAAKSSDLLMAFAEPSYKSTIALNFKHALSMVEVNLTNGGGMTDAELSTASLTIDGLQTQYTVAGTTATASSGTAANGLKPLKNGANFQFIAPAQELATSGLTMNFTVTINDEHVAYTYKNPADLTLVDGKKTVFNISVSKTAIQVAVAVEDWTIGESHSETLRIAITGTADQVTDNSAFTSMNLWLASKRLANYSSTTSTTLGASHTYTKGDDGAWTSKSPIYLDEMTANSVIYATATNTTAADAVTGFSDYLLAGPVTVQGGAAAIQFRHGMAQMTVKLAAGNGFTADITNATISTPEMLKSTAMVTTTNEDLHFVARGSETVNYTIASDATHIVVPQTLAANSIFTVTLANGNTYEAKLDEAVTLAAGVNTTITLTLEPTQVGVSAAVTAWGEAAAAATVQLAGTSSDINLDAITEAGDLALTYVQDGALTTTATFTYDGTAWSNATPLYWDEIAPATDYTFAALFTPDGDGLQKDYLVGLGTADSHGAQVALGDMTHALAKLTITLEAGTGVTDLATEITGSTVKLTDYTAVAVTANGSADITVASEASAIAFTTGTALFVAPQALTDANTIVLTRPNGNTYTVKLGELKDTNDAAIFGTNGIEAGKHYQITLTVNETSVGISATIAEWTPVSGSGTVTPDFQ